MQKVSKFKIHIQPSSSPYPFPKTLFPLLQFCYVTSCMQTPSQSVTFHHCALTILLLSSVCFKSSVRDLWWNSGFWGLPWTWPKAPTGSHQGAFSGLGLSHEVRGQVWRWFFTFSEDIWISARIHLHFAHCPPGNLGLHNRMGQSGSHWLQCEWPKKSPLPPSPGLSLLVHTRGT